MVRRRRRRRRPAVRREPPYTRATAGREQYTGDARVRALHLRYVFERVTEWSRQATFVSIDRCSGVQCRVGVQPRAASCACGGGGLRSAGLGSHGDHVLVCSCPCASQVITATQWQYAPRPRILCGHGHDFVTVVFDCRSFAWLFVGWGGVGLGIAGAHSQDACRGGARFPFLTTVARAVCATRAGARSSLVAHLRSFHRWAPIVGGSVDLCCDVTGLACAVALSLVTLVTTAIPLASVCRRLMWRTRVVRDGVTLVRSSISSPR